MRDRVSTVRALTAGVLVLLGALLATGPAVGEEAPAGSVPFVVSKSTTLRAGDGPVYVIDGPVVIPPGVEIGVELDVRIVGINQASVEVQGGLKVRGTQDHWVKIQNVDFSPTRQPRKGLHLDMVDLEGVTFRHTEGPAFEGELTIENAAMQRDCVFDVRMKKGVLKLMTIEWGVPATITAAPEQGRTKDVLVQVRSCWLRAIALTGPCDATFRHSQVRDGLQLRGVTDVTVDGCDITQSLEVRQGKDDLFKDLTITKCNFFGPANVVLHREANPDAKAERVRLDKCCWIDGSGTALQKPAAIDEFIQDAEDEPTRRVKARVTAPAKRPHQFVNTTTLRLRVPAVR